MECVPLLREMPDYIVYHKTKILHTKTQTCTHARIHSQLTWSSMQVQQNQSVQGKRRKRRRRVTTDRLMKSSTEIPVPRWDAKHDSAATEIWQSDYILAHRLKVTVTGRGTGEVNKQSSSGCGLL